MSYSSGDMRTPKVEEIEALTLEAGYFIDCITKQETLFIDGRAGLRGLRILEAEEQSLKSWREGG